MFYMGVFMYKGYIHRKGNRYFSCFYKRIVRNKQMKH